MESNGILIIKILIRLPVGIDSPEIKFFNLKFPAMSKQIPPVLGHEYRRVKDHYSDCPMRLNPFQDKGNTIERRYDIARLHYRHKLFYMIIFRALLLREFNFEIVFPSPRILRFHVTHFELSNICHLIISSYLRWAYEFLLLLVPSIAVFRHTLAITL